MNPIDTLEASMQTLPPDDRPELPRNMTHLTPTYEDADDTLPDGDHPEWWVSDSDRVGARLTVITVCGFIATLLCLCGVTWARGWWMYVALFLAMFWAAFRRMR